MRKFVVWVTEKNDEDVTLEDFITITTRHLANQRGELCNVWRTIQFNANIYLANGALWIRFDGSLFIIWWRLNAIDKLSISERTLSPEGYNRDNPDICTAIRLSTLVERFLDSRNPREDASGTETIKLSRKRSRDRGL